MAPGGKLSLPPIPEKPGYIAMINDRPRFTKMFERIPGFRAASPRRIAACSVPAIAVLALAAALLWLLPADPALAQDDAKGPKITGAPAIASSPQSGGVYRAGETITVTLTFSEPVTVTGKPRLRLKIGDKKRWAGYESAVGATLNFTHTVKPSDVDIDGISIGKSQLKLKGGTIADADGNAARLKHPKLADQAGHKVKGAPDEPEPEPTATPTPQPDQQQQASNSEPAFAAASTVRSVDENTAAGTSVGAPITATDGDNDTLTYALTGADAGVFDFDTATGQIKVKDALNYETEHTYSAKKVLNYETKDTYSVTVTVSDGKADDDSPDTAVDDTVAVTINIGNVDEPGTLTLDTETPQVGNKITFDLTDPDGIALWRGVWYRSSDGTNWGTYFNLNYFSYTPTADDLGYYLRVEADYSDKQGGNANRILQMTIGPVTAHHLTPPEVRSVSIASTPKSGDSYRVGETVQVAVHLSKAMTVNGEPRVGLTVGSRTRKAGYDHAELGGVRLIFTYTVQADDIDYDGVSIGENQLELNGGTINDSNGNAANLAHPALSHQAGHRVNGSSTPFNNQPKFSAATAARSVAENTAAGVNIGDPVTATDGDGDTLTYALTGADAAAFDFDTATGQIKVKDSLNYEAKASYSVTVTVHDSKNSPGEADTTIDDSIEVTIGVVNVDEEGTVALDSQMPEFNTVLTASLTDPDVGVRDVTWTWESSADRTTWVAINGATQAVYTPVARDSGKYLRATACYTDGEGSGKTAHAVTANAVVVPAGIPYFASATAVRSVDENTAAGTSVGAPITATDGDNDTLTYALTGADAGVFDFDTATGQIKVKDALNYETEHTYSAKKVLNYETKDTYSVTVTVSDGKADDDSPDTAVDDTVAVTINIGNVDEPGTLTLDTETPQVGNKITFDLTDPDGIALWRGVWYRSSDGTNWGTYFNLNYFSYTPTADDLGYYLRVEADYSDKQGGNANRILQMTIGPVTAP